MSHVYRPPPPHRHHLPRRLLAPALTGSPGYLALVGWDTRGVGWNP